MKQVKQAMYRLVAPEHFTSDQRRCIDQLRSSITCLAGHASLILGAKDIHSCHFFATDACAEQIECMKSSGQTGGPGMPDEDRHLLADPDQAQRMQVLSRFQIEDQVHTLLFEKQLLRHVASQSILGTVYHATRLDSGLCCTLLPDFVLELGMDTSVQRTSGPKVIGRQRFSDYEYEVCYLIAMNWGSKQIVEFLNRFRPNAAPRTLDTLYKCRNRICDKLGLPLYKTRQLRQALLAMGVHKKMPTSFFRHIAGSRVIEPQATTQAAPRDKDNLSVRHDENPGGKCD